jgi:hypothetical protein
MALVGAGLALTIPVHHPLFDAQEVAAEREAHLPVVLVEDTSAKGHGRRHDVVRHGRVLDGTGHPIAAALVTVLSEDGGLIDWSHTDGAGDFAIAVPKAQPYRTLVSADGWQPESSTVDFARADVGHELRLVTRAAVTVGLDNPEAPSSRNPVT